MGYILFSDVGGEDFCRSGSDGRLLICEVRDSNLVWDVVFIGIRGKCTYCLELAVVSGRELGRDDWVVKGRVKINGKCLN